MAKKIVIETYLSPNKENFFVDEGFIRTLKNKIYNYMTSISKNVCSDKLYDIENKYNSIYHKTIKMKSVDVNPNTYIDFNKKFSEVGPKFKVVIMFKYQKVKIFLQKVRLLIGLKNFCD